MHVLRTLAGVVSLDDEFRVALGQGDAETPLDAEQRIKAAHALAQHPEFRAELRKRTLEETKRGVRESFTEDQLAIASIRLIEDLDRGISMLGKRFHEWYGLAFPAAAHAAEPDAAIRAALSGFPDDEAMSAALRKEDLEHIKAVAAALDDLRAFRERESHALEEKMRAICPNITAIAGAGIGAKLLSKAGSLQRLATLPSGTVQMLGAEQALFRHLRNRNARPPKYGILHEHPLILTAKRSDHGKVARALADKLSLAARVDYFKGEFIGDQLRAKLDERFGSRP